MWTIPDYTGQYAYGTDGALKIGMFELTRAVNERQEAIGVTKTTWYKGNGTQAADIVMSDLEGLQINGTLYKANFDKIYSAIRAMCTSFIELSSGTPVADTPWSTATLEAAIGGDLSPVLAGTRTTDPTLFQVPQDALDLLLYAFEILAINLSSSTSHTGGSQFSGSYRSGIADPPPGDLLSAQAAWDAIGTYTGTFGTKIGSACGVTAYGHGTGPGPVPIHYDASRRKGSQNIEVDFSFLGVSFPVYSTWYYVVQNNDLDVDIDWTFGGAGNTHSPGASLGAYYEGTPISSLTSTTYASLSTSFDATTTVPASPVTASQVGSITPQIAKVIFDISSALTDQA